MGIAKRLLAFDSLGGARARVTERLPHITGVFECLLLDYYCHCGARMGFAKRVPAFDSLCGARTGVVKHVLAFDGLCGAVLGVAKRAIAFDSLCGGQTGTPKCPSTISAKLEQGLENVILTSNVYSVFV